jgi:uncharacterized protein
MRIAITGAGGLIGKALRERLADGGHGVVRVGRYVSTRPPDVSWSIPHGQLEGALLEGLDAVVHLAGEPIVGKWTPEKMRAIRDSRVDGTRLLAATLANLQRKPAVLISASAVGYYGDRGDEVLDETSGAGEGFLAGVGLDWEAAAQPAADAGIRVVHARLGVVLSRDGGALKRMLPVFGLGLGGPLGRGGQWMSWVGLDDVVGAVLYLIAKGAVSGPVNVVSPGAATNREFTQTLAGVLRRPAMFPLPKFAARLVFGRLADEVLFASQRVEPGVLKRSGYGFIEPELAGALRGALGR